VKEMNIYIDADGCPVVKETINVAKQFEIPVIIICEDEGLELAKQIESELNTPIQIQSLGPVIGCHVGPGSIGIAYFVK
jgi:uncharacterized protein YaiI (UPF0178 family)